MSDDINVPNSFYSGTAVTWQDSYDDFQSADFSVSYHFASNSTSFSVDGSWSSSDRCYDFDLSEEAPDEGVYNYQIIASQSSPVRKYFVGSGKITVKSLFDGLSGSAGYDSRTFSEKMLQQVNEWLLDNGTNDRQKIVHEGMEVYKYDREGLLLLRDKLLKEVAVINENRAAKKRGSPFRTVRFSTK